jgi:hypothetical protein
MNTKSRIVYLVGKIRLYNKLLKIFKLTSIFLFDNVDVPSTFS